MEQFFKHFFLWKRWNTLIIKVTSIEDSIIKSSFYLYSDLFEYLWHFYSKHVFKIALLIRTITKFWLYIRLKQILIISSSWLLVKSESTSILTYFCYLGANVVLLVIFLMLPSMCRIISDEVFYSPGNLLGISVIISN